MYNNNTYDMDCITFAPSGRILQVEYATKAVEQGEAVLGLRSDTDVVLCSIKRSQSQLAEHQQKIFKIDNHMCVGVAGLTADARVLAEYMRNECLNHSYIYDSPMNVGRLVLQIADKSQQKTQNSSKRPYGVGLLVAGIDEKGPHLFETMPDGNYYEFHAMAIGGRSTSAKTYMEKHFEKFKDTNQESLIQFAVEALNKTTISTETTLTTKNTSVAIVSKDGYKMLTEEELQAYINALEKKEEEADAAMEHSSVAVPMDTSS